MYEHDEGLYAAISRNRATVSGGGSDSWPFPGKHEMHDEIAEETPIFHALTVGGWRTRQRRGEDRTGRGVRSVHRPTVSRTADELAAFHSDPLHAPVPAQVTSRRRRDAERAADRRAVAGLLHGQGRHRLTASA